MLVEEGKLNWTTTLGELFADTVKPMHPAWEKVTLRQVLEHRAGLPFAPDGLVRVLNLYLARYASLRSRPESMRSSEETLPQQRLEIASRPFRARQESLRAPNTGIPMSATFSRGQCWNTSPVVRGKT
jgi:CubicO group peptidase (beta-lactamase class C family)